MSYIQKLQKLDEESLEGLTEGSGPIDQCICPVLSPPNDESRLSSVKASLKKAFGSISGRKAFGSISGGRKKKKEDRRVDFGGNKKTGNMAGKRSIDIPLVYKKGIKGVYTTKEVVKRGSCGKCSCDKSDVVLKHSYANIRITSPDVSSICPCPTDCLPNRAKLEENIRVTIERVELPHGAHKFEEHGQLTPEESRQASVNEEMSQLSVIQGSSESVTDNNDVEKLEK